MAGRSMDDVVLTWTPGNWLTVVTMAVLAYIAVRVIVLLYARVNVAGA